MGQSHFGVVKVMNKCCSNENNDEVEVNPSHPFTKQRLIIHQDYKRFEK
jgi:hypothetical protein